MDGGAPEKGEAGLWQPKPHPAVWRWLRWLLPPVGTLVLVGAIYAYEALPWQYQIQNHGTEDEYPVAVIDVLSSAGLPVPAPESMDIGGSIC